MTEQLYRMTPCAPTEVPGSRAAVVQAQRVADAAAKEAAPFVHLTDARIAELRAIAGTYKDSVRRVEEALRRGPLNSVEALFLGSLHVPARIQQLRARYEFSARWVRVVGLDLQHHTVKEWSLDDGGAR